MYTIKLNNEELFYDPRIKKYAIQNPVLKLEANRIGTFSFIIGQEHPLFESLILKVSELFIFNGNGKLICVVVPVSRRMTFNRRVEYDCEEAFIKANRSVLPTYTAAKTEGLEARISTASLNSIKTGLTPITPPKDILIMRGYITNAFDAAVKEENNVVNEWTYFFDWFLDGVVNKLDGYFVPTYLAEIPEEYDYITDEFTTGIAIYNYYTEEEIMQQRVCGQTISLGKNLLDISVDTDSEDFFTVLFPLGADTKTSTANRNRGASSGWPLTIYGLDNSKRDSRDLGNGDSQQISAWWIGFADAINEYGFIPYIHRWDKIKNQATLYQKGLEYYLNNRMRMPKTISLTAVDLADAGVDIESLEFMTMVYCKSELHEVGQYYLIRRMQINLANPSASKIEAGRPRKLLTDMTNSNTTQTDEVYNKLNDRVFYLENG